METFHLLISGKVQGVFFRASAKKVATANNIKGWIKNCRDNRVEAVITGESADVNSFITWCKSGPEKANVIEVSVSRHELVSFDHFEIVR